MTVRLDLTAEELRAILAWAETALSGLTVGGALMVTEREERVLAKLREALAGLEPAPAERNQEGRE
jgi:hypothetical protein